MHSAQLLLLAEDDAIELRDRRADQLDRIGLGDQCGNSVHRRSTSSGPASLDERADDCFLLLDLCDLTLEVGDARAHLGDFVRRGAVDEVLFFNFASSLSRSCWVFALRFCKRASSAAGSSIRPASGEEIVRWSMLAVADGGSCAPAATM